MNTVKLATTALLLAGAPAMLSAQDDTTASDTPPPAAVPTPAATNDIGVVVGATVYDLQNGVVGRIASVNGENVVVDTGTSRATLAKSGFARGTAGPVIGMTRAQLDQAVANASKETDAKLATALVAGAMVHSSDGVMIGTIKEIDASGNIVLDRPAGVIALPKSQFTADANGAAQLRFTSAQLEAALARLAPAPSAGQQ